ncbi:MAG: hypothetical protein AAFV07_04610, partial [Bacteroidota bacterium]
MIKGNSHRHLLTLLGYIWAGTILGQPKVPGLPITYHYAAETYGAGTQNWAILQEPGGLLYAANHFGLLTYDGDRWELHQQQASASLKSLASGSDGQLFAGGQGKFGYFMPNTQGLLQFHSLHQDIPAPYRNFDEVWHIYATDKGTYFTTHSYIFKLTDDSLSVISHPTEISYAFYLRNRLYVSGREEGLLVEEEGTLIQVPGGAILAHQNIRSMLEVGPNDVLIATHKGHLFRMQHNEIRRWYASVDNLLQASLINCAIQLRDGRLVIGTQNQGLYILNPDGVLQMHLDRGKGLHSHSVLGLFEGDYGTLWAATANGISQVELGAPFTLLNEQTGLKGAGYAATIWNGKLILGTTNGAFFQSATGFVPVSGSSGQVWSFSHQQGALLMGHHEGAFVYRNGTFQSFSGQKGAWNFLPRK